MMLALEAFDSLPAQFRSVPFSPKAMSLLSPIADVGYSALVVRYRQEADMYELSYFMLRLFLSRSVCHTGS